VAAMLFLPEDLSGRAEALFSGLEAEHPSRLYVPDLLYVEVTHVLLKHVRGGRYSARDVEGDLAGLLEMDLRPVPTRDLVEDAQAIALRHGLSVYDACYVVLSARVSAPLVTADQKLVRALRGSAFRVQWLGDFGVE
jgi:predicted nucleic acid-binding protein